jgi:hypothetical protein
MQCHCLPQSFAPFPNSLTALHYSLQLSKNRRVWPSANAIGTAPFLAATRAAPATRRHSRKIRIVQLRCRFAAKPKHRVRLRRRRMCATSHARSTVRCVRLSSAAALRFSTRTLRRWRVCRANHAQNVRWTADKRVHLKWESDTGEPTASGKRDYRRSKRRAQCLFAVDALQTCAVGAKLRRSAVLGFRKAEPTRPL